MKKYIQPTMKVVALDARNIMQSGSDPFPVKKEEGNGIQRSKRNGYSSFYDDFMDDDF